MSKLILVGVDIGQKRDPTAICVAETDTRVSGDRSSVHYLIRHMERLPTGTSFPEVAKRTAEVAEGVRRHANCRTEVFVDATGIGMPVVNLVQEAVASARTVTPVFFTHGDRRIETGTGWRPEVQLGKAYLVSRLQTLLQAGRLHLPRTAEAETLALELLEYEIHVDENANNRYGAFRVGNHDDRVTALGLAVQRDPVGPGIY